MKSLKYILYGIIFAIILIKVEAVSWFRIQEMFYFQSFHMYGVLFSGILVAMIGVFIIRKFTSIEVKPKPLQFRANTIGGICFGIGWGITGACTGPVILTDRIINFSRDYRAIRCVWRNIYLCNFEKIFASLAKNHHERRNQINSNATAEFKSS
jgi:hypothetical protein